MEISLQKIARQRTFIRWALLICIPGNFVFYPWLLIYYPENQFQYILIYGILFVLLLSFFLLRKRIPDRFIPHIAYLIFVILSISHSFFSLYVDGFRNPAFINLMLIIIFSGWLLELKFLNYLILQLLIISFHFILVSFHNPFYNIHFYSQLFFIGVSFSITSVFNRIVQRIRAKEDAIILEKDTLLKEKDILIKEIHHRVKNNLQIISSLLDLQANTVINKKAKSAIKDSQARVKSMALIHQLLYQSEMYAHVDFPKYLENIIVSLQAAFYNPEKTIIYEINAGKMELSIDYAIKLGLITNEIVSNSYKYAFKNRRNGKIIINSQFLSSKEIYLQIIDNGTGLPLEYNTNHLNTLGLRLVKLLSQQIKAEISFKNNDGTVFELKAPFNEITTR
ncbi:MAG: sensor histidine kinase [Bacteroidales bacterium]|nr:sensor histidine kinase [Bacteroidales bacterium]